MTFSKRIEAIKPSATLKAGAKAKELKSKGIPLIDFTVGEPDFNTPDKVKEACKKALDENWTHYAPVQGLPELRQAIGRTCGYAPEEIIIHCGAKHAIYAALQVLINPGDEVVIPAPYWTSYPDQVLLAEGHPVIVPTDDAAHFKITPSQLEKAITPKTKMVILNTPSNPTGACYSGEELKKLGEVCAAKNVWVLSDEIYDKLTYDGFQHVSFGQACPALRDKIILINGASKSYARTGWRMGYTAGPKELIAKMQILLSQELTTIPTFVQRACIAAFSDCSEEVEAMRQEFEKRRNLMWERLSKVPGIRCNKPQGAFYLFPNVGSFKKSSQEIADQLLEEAHVAVVAGEAFGAPGYLRLSYACDTATIEKGIEKIRAALTKIG